MKKRFLVTVLLMAMGFIWVTGAPSSAEETAFAIKAGATMKEVLSEQTGKKAAVKLESGEEIEGSIILVGNSLVHISRLAGKEFYDSVVKIDSISAVRMKVRDR